MDDNEALAADDKSSLGNVSCGVVAGLSQMFEDMSGMKEKRGPSRNSASASLHESGSSAAVDLRLPTLPTLPALPALPALGAVDAVKNVGVMDALPSGASPPPVPKEIETYNSSPASSHQETRLG